MIFAILDYRAAMDIKQALMEQPGAVTDDMMQFWKELEALYLEEYPQA